MVDALEDTGYSYEIHILDNGSQDGTPHMLQRLAQAHPDHIFPCYEAVNLGTTKSRNRLFAQARGKYLCVVDSDVELARGVVDTLLPLVANDRGIGIVAPRILYPSGAWQKSFDRFPTVFDKLNRFFRLREIEQREALQIDTAMPPFAVDYVISAFWLMRREVLDSVGLLDERIFYSPEDVDFCLRVWKAGYRVVYAPAVSIIHHTQEISRGFKLNRAKFSHIKGLMYYFLKHRYFFKRPIFLANQPKPSNRHYQKQ